MNDKMNENKLDHRRKYYLVLDCGVKPSKRFVQSVSGLCITHCHTDHSRYAHMYRGVPIIGTKEELNNKRILSQYDMISNVPKFVYIDNYLELEEFKITALKASHDTDNPVHFIITIGKFMFFYGCDSVDYPPEYDEYFDKCDLIMVDCNYDEVLMQTDRNIYEPYSPELKERIIKKGHASNQYIKERFGKYEKKLILGHLSQGYNLTSKTSDIFDCAVTVASNNSCPITIEVRYEQRRDSKQSS